MNVVATTLCFHKVDIFFLTNEAKSSDVFHKFGKKEEASIHKFILTQSSLLARGEK